MECFVPVCVFFVLLSTALGDIFTVVLFELVR